MDGKQQTYCFASKKKGIFILKKSLEKLIFYLFKCVLVLKSVILTYFKSKGIQFLYRNTPFRVRVMFIIDNVTVYV